jgi:methyl-accepting chemotaxis protein
MTVLPRDGRRHARGLAAVRRWSAGGSEARSDDAGSIARIAEETGRLGVEIVDVAGNIDSVAANAAAQAEAFTRLRYATGAIRQSTASVAATADGVRHHAATADAQVRESHHEISTALGSLERLAGWVGDVGEQLNSVVSRLDSIAQVTQQMDRIAAQTHILALNARIEATRAGDHGKGFAVIADNVRALADQSAVAAGQIDETVAGLTGPLQDLRQQTEAAGERADQVRSGVDSLSKLVEHVSGRDGTDGLRRRGDRRHRDREPGAGGRVRRGAGRADRGDPPLQRRARAGPHPINRLLATAEKVLGLTAASGETTVDTRFIDASIEAAGRVAALFEEALDTGRITRQQLFDETYRPLPDTDPPQFLTDFTALTDALLPPDQEAMLDFDERVAFSAAVDRNGYLPTHNIKFSQPQGDDVAWNTANCRNRRMFNDRTGLAAGRNTERYLLQTYRRDMGGGTFALMKDVSRRSW